MSSYNDNLERGLLDVYTDGSVADDLYSFFTGGIYASAYTGNTQRTTLNNGASLFVQDEYKVARHLTANLGLRWEYFGPLSEKDNQLSNLGPDGLLHMVGTGGVNSAWRAQAQQLLAARRYQLAGCGPKLVVRAGYGLYYDYIPQDVIIANYTDVAGITTNPIGPKPVLPLSFDGSAWASGSGPVFTPVSGGPYATSS